ncbi:unnamed protein product [marine sediment metagenome]|uniref:Uncharacterized protein n=1 Tax=marine sediment metagenome TaxID=412755 RepID=X0VWP7_9ZZZZ
MDDIVDFDDFDFEESEPKRKKSRMQQFKDFFKNKCPHCGKPAPYSPCPHCGERDRRAERTWHGPR